MDPSHYALGANADLFVRDLLEQRDGIANHVILMHKYLASLIPTPFGNGVP
jgi:hypothetical protein